MVKAQKVKTLLVRSFWFFFITDDLHYSLINAYLLKQLNLSKKTKLFLLLSLHKTLIFSSVSSCLIGSSPDNGHIPSLAHRRPMLEKIMFQGWTKRTSWYASTQRDGPAAVFFLFTQKHRLLLVTSPTLGLTSKPYWKGNLFAISVSMNIYKNYVVK